MFYIKIIDTLIDIELSNKVFIRIPLYGSKE
ncbi:MAG: hypothetical protein METHAR1v1_1400006 [Methanothrix sp.]|nr:MAG: hypothetical protein METHAR1v1_1400006 [Methanothrix sp.]